jgi:hypothetical protein
MKAADLRVIVVDVTRFISHVGATNIRWDRSKAGFTY